MLFGELKKLKTCKIGLNIGAKMFVKATVGWLILVLRQNLLLILFFSYLKSMKLWFSKGSRVVAHNLKRVQLRFILKSVNLITVNAIVSITLLVPAMLPAWVPALKSRAPSKLKFTCSNSLKLSASKPIWLPVKVLRLVFVHQLSWIDESEL